MEQYIHIIHNHLDNLSIVWEEITKTVSPFKFVSKNSRNDYIELIKPFTFLKNNNTQYSFFKFEINDTASSQIGFMRFPIISDNDFTKHTGKLYFSFSKPYTYNLITTCILGVLQNAKELYGFNDISESDVKEIIFYGGYIK